LTLAFCVAAYAKETQKSKAGAKSYEAGGTPIVIPPPVKELPEVGENNRHLFDMFVPAENRLLAAFTSSKDLGAPIYPGMARGGKEVDSPWIVGR
jgi:hypothetical protein